MRLRSGDLNTNHKITYVRPVNTWCPAADALTCKTASNSIRPTNSVRLASCEAFSSAVMSCLAAVLRHMFSARSPTTCVGVRWPADLEPERQAPLDGPTRKLLRGLTSFLSHKQHIDIACGATWRPKAAASLWRRVLWLPVAWQSAACASLRAACASLHCNWCPHTLHVSKLRHGNQWPA